MRLQTNTVTCAVLQEFFESRFTNLIQAHFVYFLRNGSFPELIGRLVMGSQHRLVKAFCVVVGLAYNEGSLTLHVIPADLGAQAQDQRVSRLKTILTGDRVRERRS